MQSLLKQDFAIVGAITSPAGPGLFLQKKEQLFVCSVAETPQSQTVATHYRKLCTEFCGPSFVATFGETSRAGGLFALFMGGAFGR